MLDDNMAFGLCWSAIIDYFYPNFEYRPLKFHKNLFNTFLAIFFSMYCNNQNIYSLLIYLDKENKKIFVRYINVSHHDSEFS